VSENPTQGCELTDILGVLGGCERRLVLSGSHLGHGVPRLVEPGLPQESSRRNIVAVKLRLMRMGKKKQPTYRLVAADSHNARDGRFIEILGTYEPRQDPSRILFDNDKIVHWLSVGAQPTETVAKLIKISGASEQFAAAKTAK
jgi:small subunit ribosomal protein S16